MNWLVKTLKSLVREVAELSPGCRQATHLQSLALDRPLSVRQRLGLRAHLCLCKWCRRYGNQLRFLGTTARQQDGHSQTLPSHCLRPEIRQRIKDRLRDDAK